jgi:hypothetical protein
MGINGRTRKEADRFTRRAEESMKTKYRVFPAKEFIKVTAEGSFDLEDSKKALKILVEKASLPGHFDILTDLREAECELSVADVFELTQWMVRHRPSFKSRIAVLVPRGDAFDKAGFLELCADNRGLRVHAFVDPSEAEEWLGVEDST